MNAPRAVGIAVLLAAFAGLFAMTVLWAGWLSALVAWAIVAATTAILLVVIGWIAVGRWDAWRELM